MQILQNTAFYTNAPVTLLHTQQFMVTPHVFTFCSLSINQFLMHLVENELIPVCFTGIFLFQTALRILNAEMLMYNWSYTIHFHHQALKPEKISYRLLDVKVIMWIIFCSQTITLKS